ncbi:MAG: relaxase/mobilization nuclease domain-containing protein [Bacilli bacterium]|nr:relaxase/mobilization nuclease domain-containing protein [Bacilli bacterium]
MATTALWKVGTNLNRTIEYVSNSEKTNKNGDYKLKDLKSAISYACNNDKTENSFYVTGINCNQNSAYEEMMLTKKTFDKTDGILAFHGYQSFVKDEATPELAHEIGIKLAEELWGDSYEVLVTTHLNSNNIHNHFVVNSVSFINGNKYRNTIANYAEMRRINDELCKEYNLNVLEEKPTLRTHIDYSIYKNVTDEKIRNYYTMAKNDIDNVIKVAKSYKDFERLMYKMDYYLYYRSNKLSIRNKNYKRNIRVERYFGEDYSILNIKKRIYDNLYEKKINRLKNIPPPFNTKRTGGILGLYKYYCYLLKIYPYNLEKNNISFSMRMDVEKMETISRETNFLVKNKIETKEDLEYFLDISKNTLDILKDNRSKLWYQYKKTRDSYVKSNIKKEIQTLNKKIKEENKNIEISESIKDRSEQIKNNLSYYEEKNREEMDKSEPIK